MCVYMYVCMCVCMYVCVFAHMWVCISMYVCVALPVCACVCCLSVGLPQEIGDDDADGGMLTVRGRWRQLPVRLATESSSSSYSYSIGRWRRSKRSSTGHSPDLNTFRTNWTVPIEIATSKAILTRMLVVANLANTKWCKKPWKMTETLARGYSSESTHWELSNENQHDRVRWFLKIFTSLCLGRK